MVAYRTIETVCNVAAAGVGLPVQIAIADKDGAAHTERMVRLSRSGRAWTAGSKSLNSKH